MSVLEVIAYGLAVLGIGFVILIFGLGLLQFIERSQSEKRFDTIYDELVAKYGFDPLAELDKRQNEANATETTKQENGESVRQGTAQDSPTIIKE